jgi:spore coat polysaccharide biosynthesis protein SpsF
MSRRATTALVSSVPRSDARLVLQARMGSSRLPGKVLARLGGRSVLAHCMDRLTAARVGELVVATTTRPEDDAVVEEATRAGVRVVRGPVDDVLGRFVLAVADWDGPYVIRATADNPLVDVEASARVLRALDRGADYCVEDGLPVGAAVEALRTEALRDAAALATSAYDREHVTPFVRHSPDRFAVHILAAPPALRRPALRLTIDTRHDLQFVRSLVEQAGHDRPSLATVLGLAERSAWWAGVA